MYRAVFAVLVGVGAVALAGSRPAYAFDMTRLDVHIPFTFQIDKVELPPGDYEVDRPSALTPQVLLIRLRDGRRSRLFFVQEATPSTDIRDAELVFDRYADRTFLHAIWLPGQDGATIPMSRSELQEAHGSNPAEPTTVLAESVR